MRSRAARLILGVAACIALAAAGYFVFTTEQKISGRQAALRSFDLRAREATFALADARAGQQAYVAAGQSSTYWMPKVTATLKELETVMDTLRGSAVSSGAHTALLDASESLTEFASIDKRVRDYLASDESLMASDVAFSEGNEASGRAALQVETARVEERKAFDADEAALRRFEAYALAGAAGFTALILAIFALAPSPKAPAAAIDTSDSTVTELPLRGDGRDEMRLRPEVKRTETAPRAAAPLKAAAELCTEFGRVRDTTELKALLARAAQLLDASGLVVWLGTADGGDLHPVMAHGYSDQVLALMRAVPRNADNAAAAAYRSGKLQVVAARPGESLGAVVAPLLAVDGCIGALTAEIHDGSETSEDVQSLASIFAAQLAGVLTPSAATNAALPQTRIASA